MDIILDQDKDNSKFMGRVFDQLKNTSSYMSPENNFDVLQNTEVIDWLKSGYIEAYVICNKLVYNFEKSPKNLGFENVNDSISECTKQITIDNLSKVITELQHILDGINKNSRTIDIQSEKGKYKERQFYFQPIIDQQNHHLGNNIYDELKDLGKLDNEFNVDVLDYIENYNIKNFNIVLHVNGAEGEKFFGINQSKYIPKEMINNIHTINPEDIEYNEFLENLNGLQEKPEINDNLIRALNDGKIKFIINMHGKEYVISSRKLEKLLEDQNFIEFLENKADYYILPVSAYNVSKYDYATFKENLDELYKSNNINQFKDTYDPITMHTKLKKIFNKITMTYNFYELESMYNHIEQKLPKTKENLNTLNNIKRILSDLTNLMNKIESQEFNNYIDKYKAHYEAGYEPEYKFTEEDIEHFKNSESENDFIDKYYKSNESIGEAKYFFLSNSQEPYNLDDLNSKMLNKYLRDKEHEWKSYEHTMNNN